MGSVTALMMDVITEKSGHSMAGLAVSVCLTPAAPAPLPIPYPTFASVSEGVMDECLRTKIDGAKVLTVGSCTKNCHGNEPGTLKEVVSLNTTGPCFPILGAPIVFIELGMAGITLSPGFMNKNPIPGIGGSASGAGGGGGGGGGAGGGAGGPPGASTSGPSNGGGGGGGSSSAAAPPSPPAPPGADGQAAAGHPVDVVTGTLFTVPIVDFSLSGFFKLNFVRKYFTSAVRERCGIGWGWAHSLHFRAHRTGDRLTLVDSDLRRTEMPIPAADEIVRMPYGRTITRHGQDLLLQIGDGMTYVLRQGATPKVLDLAEIRDAFGNLVEVRWEGDTVVEVIDTVGRVAHLERAGNSSWWMLTMRDGEGREHTKRLMTYELDERGDLVRTLDAGGVESRYEYDAEHYLVAEIRADGLVYRFVHEEIEGKKRCVETWGELPGSDILAELGAPAGEYRGKGIFHVRLTYGPDPFETTMVDAMGQTHRYRGNAFGLVERYVDPIGYQRLLTYDPFGNLVQVMDGGGVVQRKMLDPGGQVVGQSNSAGETVRFRFDAEAGTTTILAGEGYKSVERVKQGRTVEVTSAIGAKTTAKYDDRGLNTAVTHPSGLVDTLEHDAHGNLIRYESGGAAWTYEYDLLGQPVRVTTPEGGTTRFEYDSRGCLVRATDPLGRREEHAVDAMGRIVVTSFPGSGMARFRFVADALVEQVHPDGTTYRMGYDALLRLRWIENPAGERYTMEYDAAGNKVRERTFSGLTYGYERDGGGRVVSLLKPDEARVRFVRDGGGRLIANEHSNGVTERIEYDDFGRIKRVSNGVSSVELTFDPNGALLRDKQTCGGWVFTVDYRYDETGRLLGRKYSTGWSVAVETDERGHVTALAAGPDDRPERFVFERDREGKETARRRDDSAIALKTKRNAIGFPVEVALEAEDGEQLRARQYTWDACGPLSKVSDNTRGDRRFTLDPHGRPVDVTGLGASESFAIAPQGTAVPRKATWSVGPGGRPLRTDDAILHWDRAGRLAMREARDPARSWQYAYDENDRLKSAVRGDGLRIDYIYDPLGRRVAEVCGNASTWFGWDGDSIVEERATSGRTTLRVFDRPKHVPLLESPDGGSFRMIATDAASTPWMYVDKDGGVSEIDLTTWGETAYTAGEPGALRFAGQRADAHTGLFYNRNRYYAPDLHVYTTPDPIGLFGSVQDVGFVKNPTLYIDPLGLLTIITASNDPNLQNAYYSNYAAQYPGATILTPSQVTPGSLAGETDVVIDTHGAPGSVEWNGNYITGSQLADNLRGAGFTGGPGTRVEVIACNSNTSPGGLFGRSVAQAVADRTGATTSGASAAPVGTQNATQAGNSGASGLLSGMPTGLGSGSAPGNMNVNGGGSYDQNVQPRWWTFGF